MAKNYASKTYKGKHQCNKVFKNNNLNYRVLAEEYIKQIKNNLDIPIQSFIKNIYNDLRNEVTIKPSIYR